VGFELKRNTLKIESEEVILGPDMAGQQVPPRQRMLLLITVFILMIETWGLAALISAEIESGTLCALLPTPLPIPGLFTSKGFTGVFMAFTQVVVLLLVTGGLRREPLLVLTALLLGAFLVTVISFLIASVAGDMMTVIAWGMLAMIVLAIPAFNLLLPGLTTNWIKILPSYYLVDIIYRVLNFGASWGQSGSGLLTLLAVGLGFFGLGAYALRRKLG
jgi:ABC-2 type transport system permease protein